MKIGIIVAMDKEFAQLKTLLCNCRNEEKSGARFLIGELNSSSQAMINATCILHPCGIGKVNAAVGAAALIDYYHPDIIISSGVAGGAQPSMQPLDIVAGTEYAYHDVYCGSEVAYGQFVGLPPRFTTPSQLIEKARPLATHCGLIVSGDWFVDSREKMTSILNLFPSAVAVDMESCAIAHVCHLRGVPFISFRIISDVPLNDHKAAQYFDFWDRMAEGSFNNLTHFIQSLCKTN